MAVSNTLTPAISSLISNFQSVLREQVGFIKSVNTDFSDMGAAIGDTVTIPQAPAMTAADNTAGATSPEGQAVTVTNLTHAITKSRNVKFTLTGEEVARLRENREGYQSGVIQQAIRTIVNEIEVDVGATAAAASRAVGTAGTTPFASNHQIVSDLDLLMNENAAFGERHLTMDYAAKNKLGKLTTLLDASAYGSSDMVRSGAIGELGGFNLHNSAGVYGATKGTGSGYVVDNGAGYGVGATEITVKTGSNPVLAGDLVKFENDSYLYVVKTGITAAGTLVLQAPGLKAAIADDDTMTVQATSTRNYAYTRDAIALSVRTPKRDAQDQATEIIPITDPESGLTFELAYYPQFLQGTWMLMAAWGVTNVHPKKTALLLG